MGRGCWLSFPDMAIKALWGCTAESHTTQAEGCMRGNLRPATGYLHAGQCARGILSRYRRAWIDTAGFQRPRLSQPRADFCRGTWQRIKVPAEVWCCCCHSTKGPPLGVVGQCPSTVMMTSASVRVRGWDEMKDSKADRLRERTAPPSAGPVVRADAGPRRLAFVSSVLWYACLEPGIALDSGQGEHCKQT